MPCQTSCHSIHKTFCMLPPPSYHYTSSMPAGILHLLSYSLLPLHLSLDSFLPPFIPPPPLPTLQLLLNLVGDFVCWYWIIIITQLSHVSTDVSAHTHKHVNMYTCNDVHVHMYFACNEIHHPMYVACSSNELWYVVCGMWYVVCGMWCVVCGMWYVHGMWHVVHMCLCWNLTSFPTYLLSLCMWVKGRA